MAKDSITNLLVKLSAVLEAKDDEQVREFLKLLIQTLKNSLAVCGKNNLYENFKNLGLEPLVILIPSKKSDGRILKILLTRRNKNSNGLSENQNENFEYDVEIEILEKQNKIIKIGKIKFEETKKAPRTVMEKLCFWKPKPFPDPTQETFRSLWELTLKMAGETEKKLINKQKQSLKELIEELKENMREI